MLTTKESISETLAVSRRGVLVGGAALATLAAAGPSWAQVGASGSQPVVVITGTSSGFGKLIAETLARNKMRVVATMRDVKGRNAPAAAEMLSFADREKLDLDVVEIDVTDQGSVDRGVYEALGLAGRIDILVSNAGVVVPGPTELQPFAAFNANLDTNLGGAVRMFRAVAPQMRAQNRGLMIQLSSALGRIIDPMLGGYCASKLAVEGACDAIAYENAMFGVEVTIVQVAGPYPTRLQANGLRYFDEMIAGLPEADKPRIAAFEQHIVRMREGLIPDSKLKSQEVADAIGALAIMEHGSRPRRLVIGPYKEIVEKLNRVHDEVQQETIKAGGLVEFTTLRSSG